MRSPSQMPAGIFTSITFLPMRTMRAVPAAASRTPMVTDASTSCLLYTSCINPTWVKYVSEQLRGSGVKTCCVIGFPLGANTTYVKKIETEDAVQNGAEEVDMVINIGADVYKRQTLIRKSSLHSARRATLPSHGLLRLRTAARRSAKLLSSVWTQQRAIWLLWKKER